MILLKGVNTVSLSKIYGKLRLNQFHKGMVHTVAYLTFFFQDLAFSVVLAINAQLVQVPVSIVLVGIYHVLPCNKAEQQRPCANNMVRAFLHSNACIFRHKNK